MGGIAERGAVKARGGILKQILEQILGINRRDFGGDFGGRRRGSVGPKAGGWG
jgi:hypothetical protein